MSASVSWGEALRANASSGSRISGHRPKDWSAAECRSGSRIFGVSPDEAQRRSASPGLGSSPSGPGGSLVGGPTIFLPQARNKAKRSRSDYFRWQKRSLGAKPGRQERKRGHPLSRGEAGDRRIAASHEVTEDARIEVLARGWPRLRGDPARGGKERSDPAPPQPQAKAKPGKEAIGRPRARSEA